MIGCGKLGFPVALAWATQHEMVGYDVSSQPKEIMASGKYPHLEPACQKLLDNGTRFPIVDTIDDAVAHADVVFVAVQTPHKPEFEGLNRMPAERADFGYDVLKAAVQAVSDAAKAQQKHVVMVVISTVLPGTTKRELRPIFGDNPFVSFVYSPMFIAQGTVVEDTMKPEMVLLGRDAEDSLVALETMRDFYAPLHKAPLCPMNVASAELAKVAYNVFLGLKIVAANSIMEIAHKTEANCDDVTNALALATDRVVSKKYMRGGMGDGGGCFVKGELIYVAVGNGVLPTPIEKVQVGDRVLGGDGEVHTVIETYRRPYSGPVHTIRSGFGSMTVTPEHPIHVHIATSPRIEMRAGDIRVTPEVPISVYIPKLHLASEMYGDRYGRASQIEAVETSSYEGTVYNLNVADVHNYVSVGGLVSNCHPRDQIALSWLAHHLNLSYDLFGAMVHARESQTEWLAKLCLELSERGDEKLPVIVLGRAYKAGTNLTIGSPAVLLKNILDESGGEVLQWDPYVDDPESAVQVLARRAVFVIGTNHDEFYSPEFKLPSGSYVIDPWGRFKTDDASLHVTLVGRAVR